MKQDQQKELSLKDKWNDQMELIHQKTGIKGQYVLLFLIIALIFVSVGVFDRLITNLIGTVYPAYWTIKSIESESANTKQWLAYWVVFASFTLIDMFSGFILKFIPFYFFIKILFLIWLFMPNSQGSIIVYNLIIVRFFKIVEKDIDSATDMLKLHFDGLVNNGMGIILEKQSEKKEIIIENENIKEKETITINSVKKTKEVISAMKSKSKK